MTSPSNSSLLDLMARPALLISGDQVVHANPAAQQMLGAHITGQDIRLAIRNPDILSLIQSHENGHVSVKGLSTKGSIWDATCHMFDGGSQLLTLEDMSVQASIARAHADFVANASHELRTPLASILGYVETLADPTAGGDEKVRDRFLSTIKAEAQRMEALVEDLMSLSRIEANKHDAPSDKVDLSKICALSASESKVRVLFESSADNATILGDSTQIMQVMRNLVDNAIKYGGSEKPVRIGLETASTGWAVIDVTDEGEGIAPEHLPRLTERFYRVDDSRSRKVGGTGLGLSIVKHIIERHRGRFDIRSRPGEGTTASIMLPLAE
jgi:two-component system, OmpR family, phosphate regulon sensor histidine kinase PhoR